MNEAANRPGRIDRRDQPALSPRLRRHALALALLALCAFAVGAASARAATGGFSSAPAPGGEAQTSEAIVFTPLRWAGATWYGPGLYGNRTACGQTLRPGTVGVAHRSLPCGTRIKLVYRGRQLVTRVIDRGPYSQGHAWDLTSGAREALGFGGSGRVGYAIELRYARR